MPTEIQTPKEYYKDKSMGFRYWIGGFLVLIILVQLTLPRWKNLGKNDDVSSLTGQRLQQEKKITLFEIDIPLIGEYVVYNNILVAEQSVLSKTEQQQLSGYVHSNDFVIMQQIFDETDVPDDFAYIPRILTNGNKRFFDKNTERVGIWALEKKLAQKYELQVDDVIDQRYSLSAATYAISKYIRDMYYLYGDWNMVAIVLLSDNPMEIRREYVLLSQYDGNGPKYQQFMINDIMLNQSFPEPKDWITYRDFPLSEKKIFTLMYLKTLVENPDAMLVNQDITYTTQKLKGPLNLVQRSKENNHSYAVIKYLNPRVRGTQLPEGRWRVTLVD